MKRSSSLSQVLRIVLLGLSLVCAGYAGEPGPIHSSTQMLVVTTADWNAVDGTLQRYERRAAGRKWEAVGKPISVVVGKNGLGWGIGIVSSDALRNPGDTGPVKKEGDGKAPAGIFHLSEVFGYAGQEQPGWKMPYMSLTPSVECVDDSQSRFYNRVVDRSTVSPDWNSSEHMLRSDELYRWGVIVEHNASPPQPGGGSCIFLHIWRGPEQGTVGCTAMPREQLESVLAWLNPAAQPVLVQLPAAEYQRLRKKWKMP